MISDIEYLRRFLKAASGLSLDVDKMYMIESRLLPLVQKHGLETLSALIRRVESGKDIPLAHEVVEAMTTNETFFFRDRVPYDNFRNIMLPKLLQARDRERHIRIWCAACSTGQEPYSLAMIIDSELRRLKGWRVDILATDLSSQVIESAKKGVYSQFEVQRGLPIGELLRFFTQEGDGWRIAEHLRSRVRFRTFNLLSDFAQLGEFDVIFCRNVLIYFDIETKQAILSKLHSSLAEDGFLVMGAAETVVGLSDEFSPHPDHHAYFVHRGHTPHYRPALRLVAG